MLGLPDLPSSTPSWIVEEFKSFPELANQVELTAVLRDPRKVVSDKTWKTIRKHERERLIKVKTEEVKGRSLLAPLGRFLSRGMNHFDGEAKLTIKDRRKIAIDIQAAATRLELCLAGFDNYDFPVDWVRAEGNAIAGELRPLLVKLADCAEKWKAPRPGHIARPSEASAARTFFMRTLSQGFRKRYGLALNEVTLEFTTFFFPGTTLDVSGVSRRLTPIRTRRKGTSK